MDYVAVAIERCQNDPWSADSAGLSCRFIRLDDKIGVKWYGTKRDRDNTMRLQQFAYMLDVGPEVIGRPFECETDGHTFYGYLTEIIERHYDVMCEHLNGPWHVSDVVPYTDMACKKFEEFGISLEDMHTQNFGWTEKGFAVLDFDHCYHYGEDKYNDSAEVRPDFVDAILSAY